MANSSGTTHIVGPLAEAQARAGSIVSVFCVEKGSEPPVLPDPELVESRAFPWTLALDNPGVSILFARELTSRIRTFDVVHIHAIWNFPTWWAMRSAYRAGVPYIVSPQGSMDPWALRHKGWQKRLYGPLVEMPLLKKASCLQALTAKEAAQFRSMGMRNRIEVIPNGVATGALSRAGSPDPGYFGLSSNHATLIFLSRVHPKKGLDLLIDAAALLKNELPELKIVIAGSDGGSGYRETIETRCRKKNVERMFTFVGELSGEKKWNALLAADAFVLSSYSEGLPVAALEAMGVGLPVVVSEECNLPEVQLAGAGYVSAIDVRHLANAIKNIFSLTPAERIEMGRRGRKLVSRSFAWPSIADATLNCYNAIT